TPVPAWVRRIVLRGLSQEPQKRFDSMDALLAALGRDPAIVRRRVAIGAALSLAAVGMLAAGQLLAAQRARSCAAGPLLSGLWDEEAKRSVREAFAATGKPFAAGAADGVVRALDGYAHEWAASYREAC